MNQEENINDKIDRLRRTITGIPIKISEAVQDGLQEGLPDYQRLTCVEKDLLDFNLIERDIDEIHKKLKKSGDIVLGSRVIIVRDDHYIEIITYVKRDEKTFSVSVKSTVERVTNIPSDIQEEMENTGRVELSVKP
jgi:hypothetical protein